MPVPTARQDDAVALITMTYVKEQAGLHHHKHGCCTAHIFDNRSQQDVHSKP